MIRQVYEVRYNERFGYANTYEEAKQISSGLITEEGKLKMRSLMNYIDQLQM